ncbi:MAG: hypothetical protein AAGE52_27030 [Myxococcota bacterium]
MENEDLERFVSALDAIGTTLDSDAMCPDPDAKVWTLRDLHDVWTRLESCVSFVDELEGDAAVSAKQGLAGFAIEIATLAGVISDARVERAARDLAEQLAPEPLLSEVRAAGRDKLLYARLMHARWLQRRNDYTAADRVLRSIETNDEDLASAVRQAVNAPRPLTGGAPTLGTINGFGFMLYGRRDARSDGTYVATQTLTALFVPVFPVAAFRVLPQGGDGWLFLAKERLSSFAIWWRRAVIGLGVLAVVGLFVASWWNAPGRRAERELDALAGLEGEAAAQELTRFVQEHAHDAPDASERAATQLAQSLLARVEEPMTPARIDEAERVALRIDTLPPRVIGARAQIFGAAQRWAEQVGSQDLMHAEARTTLMALAVRFAGPHSEQAQAELREADLVVAGLLAPDWPLAALRRCSRYIGTETADRQFATLVTRIESPEALTEIDSSAFLEQPAHVEAREHVQAKLEDARARLADPERELALESGDADALRAQLERFPGDHSLLAALGHALRVQNPADSLALWEGIRPGTMSSPALESYALALRDAGQLEEADALLTRHVRELLPPFQEASHALDVAIRRVIDELDRKVERGEYPPGLDQRLQSVTNDQEAQAAYSEYVRERLDSNPTLADLRARVEATSGVVPSALGLAMIKLQRAEASREARESLLAEAEQVFLSIRQQAEGAPEYHLGLGRVYHRMGSVEDGDRELGQLVTQGPAMQLMVARVYRDLGIEALARQHAQAAYDGSGPAEKGEAAILLSLLATDFDEEERWLRRAPQDLPFVANGLASIRAQRAFVAGDLEEAAEIYQDVAQRFEADADSNQAASNNAAVAYQRRFECTGDPRDLERATRLLERAVRQAPDTALVVGNLASLLGRQGRIRVLDRFVRTRVLRPDTSSARTLLSALMQGPKSAEVKTRLRNDPSIRRSIDLWQQMRVLSPGTSAAHEEELAMCELADETANSEDAECLARIFERVSARDFHNADAAQRYQRFLDGSEQDVRDMTEHLAIAQRVAERAAASGHAATREAGKLLAARAAMTLAIHHDETDGLRQVAHEIGSIEWPDADIHVVHASALLAVALLESRSTPGLAQALEQQQRALGPLLFFSAFDGTDAWVETVRAQPETRQALQALRQVSTPTADAWVVAHALGEQDLAAQHAHFRESPLPVRILARLQPWRQDRALRARLLEE